MLNRAHTAVIERNVVIEGEFFTEPYELAWADSARWFIHVLEADEGTRMHLQTEISPEGLTWCNHEVGSGEFAANGLIALRVEDPGPYTRLKITMGERNRKVKAIIYLCIRQ